MSVPIEPKPHTPPVFAPKLHNETMQALSVLLLQLDMLGSPGEAEVAPLKRCADAMADSLIDELGTAYGTSEQVPIRDYQYAHPVKVAELAMILAKLAGAGRAQLRNTGLAAMLMNAGYARLRPGLLDRATTLIEQRAEMQKHPQESVDILRSAGLSDETLRAILEHHERLDGGGYPRGLKGNEISIYARIVAVADTFVALCSPRHYRPARPRLAVEEYFSVEAGDFYDPAVVRLLLETLPHRYHLLV